jgi:Zn-dependent oligopeptidase
VGLGSEDAGLLRAHYQTGQPIPVALVRQMRRASEFGQGIEGVAADGAGPCLAVAPRPRSTQHRSERLWKEIQARYVDIPFIDGTARQASFPHIGQAGYASAYYTYMWSLVIGKDLFSKFEGAISRRPASRGGIARRSSSPAARRRPPPSSPSSSAVRSIRTRGADG